MRKRNTIQSILLLYYCSLIFIIVIGFIIYFYIYFSNVLNNKAYAELLNTSKYISTGIDTEIKNIDKISMQIAYSKSINQLFLQIFQSRAIYKDMIMSASYRI